MKYKVCAGSLRFEQGTFQRGDVFDVPEEQAKLFDPNDVVPFLDVEKGKSFNRPMILAVKACFGTQPLKGAELGVFEAKHAENIFNLLNIKLLHLIDIYEPYVDDPWGTQYGFSSAKPLALLNMEPYKKRVKWHFKPSLDAALEIMDDSLDFVYIDANHSYAFVKADIEAYLPKVKVGGFIGGHDYYFGETVSPGVNKAVDEFVSNSGCVLQHDVWDWWIIKDAVIST